MTTQNKPTFAVSINTVREHGYDMTYVRIMSGEVLTVQERLDGCVDNKDGYGGGQPLADRIAGQLREVQAAGFSELFDHDFTGGVYLTVKYQRFETTSEGTTYCDPSIELGSRTRQIKANLPVFNKLTKAAKGQYRAFPKTPGELLAAFPKAIRVEQSDVYGACWLVSR